MMKMRKACYLLLMLTLLVGCVKIENKDKENAEEIEQLRDEIKNLKGELKKQDQKAETKTKANTEKATPAQNDVVAHASQALNLCYHGTIGGYDGSFMTIDNGSGIVDLVQGGKRKVKVRSFNGNELIIDAYLNNQYIGYYIGKVTQNGYHYKGVFHNTRNGGKVDFDLYECVD